MFQSEPSSSWVAQTIANIRNAIAESFDSLLNAAAAELPYLIAGVIVFLFFWLLSKIFSSIFLSATRKAKLDERLRLLASRLIVTVMIILGIVTALSIAIPSFNFSSLIAGLGLTSFVIAFAAKDIVSNFVSGILILWQEPFHIGDYVFVGSNQGKVEFIGVRATNLRKDDGELVLVPNGEMYSSAVTIRQANEARRMALKFALPYDVDLDSAKSIILKAVERTDGVVDDPKPNVLASELTSDGVTVNATFWIATNESKPLLVLDGVVTAVTEALKASNITPFETADGLDEDAKPSSEDTKQRKDPDTINL